MACVAKDARPQGGAMRSRLFAVFGWLALLGGCATIDYDALVPGSFSGSVFVMWVGEGNSSGDGNFLFVPDPQDPLIFHRQDGSSAGAVIQPGMMYTDGGSIPKIAQVFNGLSPWGYAPAYMVHDWIFVARHCILDGDPDPRYAPIRPISFEDSARILGEAIRALVAEKRVQRNDVAGTAITAAVDSIVARNLWDTKGACAASQIKDRDRAAAEAAIPGSSRFAVRRTLAVPEAATEAVPAPRKKARIITRVSF